jgi:hypothetical protein
MQVTSIYLTYKHTYTFITFGVGDSLKILIFCKFFVSCELCEPCVICDGRANAKHASMMVYGQKQSWQRWPRIKRCNGAGRTTPLHFAFLEMPKPEYYIVCLYLYHRARALRAARPWLSNLAEANVYAFHLYDWNLYVHVCINFVYVYTWVQIIKVALLLMLIQHVYAYTYTATRPSRRGRASRLCRLVVVSYAGA